MNRPRASIAAMMGAVITVAMNLAVMRSFDPHSPDSLLHFLFACGVFPMSSLLILLAVISAPTLLRGLRMRPFLLGFELSGIAAVFAFLAIYSIATPAVRGVGGAIGGWLRPTLIPYLEAAPEWAPAVAELGISTGLFSLPQLLLALLGGWLADRLKARFERQDIEPVDEPVGGRSPLLHRDCVGAGTARGLLAE
jgi:hypothetical protein